MTSNFTANIIDWHLKENKRIMPWKGEKDPYKLWISEIILQQTRVLQGLAYYDNFIEEFPTLQSLAEAADEAVFKIWEGLGYYSRCRNLLYTARDLQKNNGGNFPVTYENILSLKGIGPYTAAAIASFAYGLPHAVVDGNVFRVLARFFGEATPIDSLKGKQLFTELANNLLYTKDSATYNQAIMDFGATICKPQIPLCQQCCLNRHCIAYNNGLVNKLPVKEKFLVRKSRFFTYFIFYLKAEILVRKRSEKDIWQNLYEFYLLETDKEFESTPREIKVTLFEQLGINEFELLHVSKVFSQQLTHQKIRGRFISVQLTESPTTLQHFIKLPVTGIARLAFPKFINEYLSTYPIPQTIIAQHVKKAV